MEVTQAKCVVMSNKYIYACCKQAKPVYRKVEHDKGQVLHEWIINGLLNHNKRETGQRSK